MHGFNVARKACRISEGFVAFLTLSVCVERRGVEEHVLVESSYRGETLLADLKMMLCDVTVT